MHPHRTRYVLLARGQHLSGLLRDELAALLEPSVTVFVAPDGPLPTASIRELAETGADTIIWTAPAKPVPTGSAAELGVISGAVRDDSVTSQFLPIEFPAVADFHVTRALALGARSTGSRVRVGIAQTSVPADDEAGADDGEIHTSPFVATAAERAAAWKAAGAFCADGDAAGLFLLASTLGVRAGAIVELAGRADRLVAATLAGLGRLIAADRRDAP